MNNRNLFLTVLEAGSPRSGHQQGQVWALCWIVDFSLCPHMVEGTRKLCVVFYKVLIPFMSNPSPWPKQLPKRPTSWYHHTGHKDFSIWVWWGQIWWGHMNSDSESVHYHYLFTNIQNENSAHSLLFFYIPLFLSFLLSVSLSFSIVYNMES